MPGVCPKFDLTGTLSLFFIDFILENLSSFVLLILRICCKNFSFVNVACKQDVNGQAGSIQLLEHVKSVFTALLK